jgi:hypothetical protein
LSNLFDEPSLEELPEGLRGRISSQFANIVQAVETQFSEQVTSIAREHEQIAANYPQFQNSTFDDFFGLTDLQNSPFDVAYGMQDMYSRQGDLTPRARDESSAIPEGQADFGFLPQIWNIPNDGHSSIINPPITPSPSHSGGTRTENGVGVSSTLNEDTDVRSLLQSLKKISQALEKRIQGS